MKRGISFWFLIIVSVLLAIVIIIGQAGCLISYDFTVFIGLQEPVEEVGMVGVAGAKGFGFADTFFYLPMVLIGIVGLLKNKDWGIYSMLCSMAITVYWPMVILAAVFYGRGAGIALEEWKYWQFSILLPSVTLFGLWGIFYLYSNRNLFEKSK